MSQRIEAQFEKKWLNWEKGSYYGVVSFYFIVFVLLLAGFWFAHIRT